MVTNGPGATNMLTGIAGAYVTHAPLVAIIGGISQEHMGRGSFQEVDHVGVFRPVAKDSVMVPNARRIPNMLRQALGGSSPRVDVYLPQDVRLDLELEIAQGGAQVELGGLWLTTAELEFNQGGFQLEIGEPLRQPMERLTIYGSMGGFSASKLGNASPRELDIDFRMGGMDLDLRGHWVQDADVSISFGMGGGNVRLPKDVEIVGLAGDRVVARRDPEIKAPILTFSVSGDLDNLEFN